MDLVSQYGLQALIALGLFVAGVLVARWAGKLAQTQLERHTLEPPVRLLLVRIVKIIVLLFTGVIALDALGVPIAPLVAGIGVAGVGIGLAMQGVLSNVMAGLSIIFTKPYRVGEHISILGVHGDVVTIDIFSTILLHPDRSRIVIPNRKIVGEILHNFGTIRQLHLTIGVGHRANLEQALTLAKEVLHRNPRVLKDPAPAVAVSVIGDASVVIAVEPWTSVSDFAAAQGDLNAALLQQFQAHGIDRPIPFQEVRLVAPSTLDS